MGTITERAQRNYSGVAADRAAIPAAALNVGDKYFSTDTFILSVWDGAAWRSAGGIGVLDVYPVGAIYISVVATSPATLFGGTWAAFGAGKVLVGIDSEDEDFDTPEETGGEKKVSVAHTHTTPDHTLTENEIPAHSHGMDQVDTSSAGSSQRIIDGSPSDVQTGITGGGQAHNHGPTGAMSANATPSIVQPYIVVYMWKRTA